MTNNIESLAFRINDACQVLSISRTSIYKMIAEGRLKTIKNAGRTLISRSEIDRLLKEATSNA